MHTEFDFRELMSTNERCNLRTSFSTKYWPYIAFFAGVLFSLHNILFMSQVVAHKEYGLLILLPYWIGELPLSVLALLIKCLWHFKIEGTMWQKSTSKYYKNGSLDVFNVIGLVVRAALIHVALICYYYELVAIETAKVDLAFSAFAIFAIASLFSTLIFRVCFGEALLKKHFLGMIIIAFALLSLLNY